MLVVPHLQLPRPFPPPFHHCPANPKLTLPLFHIQILISASSALYNLLFRTTSISASLLSALAAAGAWYHFSAHWASQARIPGATQWNEAVEASGSLRTWLLVLAGAWVVGGVVGLVG